jgi:hypothetical protein
MSPLKLAREPMFLRGVEGNPKPNTYREPNRKCEGLMILRLLHPENSPASLPAIMDVTY